MQSTVSYAVKITNMKNMLKPTVDIYRKALTEIITIVNTEWNDIIAITGIQERKTFIERLIHTTKDNTAKYEEFDKQYYKMPSYFRRSVIAEALGIVSSYKSNYKNWETKGKQGNPPRLQRKHYSCPVFYRDNTYKTEDDITYLKLFVRNDWIWVPVKLRKTDLDYINKYYSHAKMSAPTLEKRRNGYYLRFAFTENVILNAEPISSQKILAIDLGINTDAVCSVMVADGTVLGRKFINFQSEKDHLYHSLNKIKRYQRQH